MNLIIVTPRHGGIKLSFFSDLAIFGLTISSIPDGVGDLDDKFTCCSEFQSHGMDKGGILRMAIGSKNTCSFPSLTAILESIGKSRIKVPLGGRS